MPREYTDMIDARHYLSKESLRNGLEICIRASRPDDIDRLLEAFHKLAPESIYLRYFGPKKEFSAAEIRRIQEADFTNRVILICTVQEGDQEIAIASGTYIKAGNNEAEIAFVVEEDYHRLGIARRLLTHLGIIAKDAGIHAFVAEVLPHNTAMLNVFRRCGWPMKSHTEDGTTHLRLELNSN